MNYVSQIDATVNSVFAHSIEFKAGVPTQAPPALHDELVARGIMPEDYVAPEAAPDVPVALEGAAE